MKIRSLALFGLGALSMVPVVAYARHRARRDLAGGVMEPMTQIYTAQSGVVDDAELIEPPAEDTPNIVP
jgi:hypothetical protein